LHVPFLTFVDGFPAGSLVGLLVGLLIGFLVLFPRLFNGFRGGSLVGLLVGLLLSFLTLVDSPRRLACQITRQIDRLFSYTRRRLLRPLPDLITRQITRRIRHPVVRELSHSFQLAMALLTFDVPQLSSMAFTTIRAPCVSNCVGLHIKLRVGLLVVLHSTTAFLAARSSDYPSDCASPILHSLTAFVAACSSYYSSDCASLFLHSSTSFAAAGTSNYSSDCPPLCLHLSTAFFVARSWDYSSDYVSLSSTPLTAFAAARLSDDCSDCAPQSEESSDTSLPLDNCYPMVYVPKCSSNGASDLSSHLLVNGYSNGLPAAALVDGLSTAFMPRCLSNSGSDRSSVCVPERSSTAFTNVCAPQMSSNCTSYSTFLVIVDSIPTS